MTQPVCAVIGVGPMLGYRLVETFARHGCRVAAVARGAEALEREVASLRARDLDVTAVVGDAGDSASTESVFARIRQELGDPDILIYNAFLGGACRLVTHQPLPEIRYTPRISFKTRPKPADVGLLMDSFRIGVAGALDAVQHVLPGMRRLGRGRILLTGGGLSYEPEIEFGVTALVKAALLSLGRSLVLELSTEGIRVTNVMIHGAMEEGTPLDPKLVAQTYWRLCAEPAEDWQQEVHLRR